MEARARLWLLFWASESEGAQILELWRMYGLKA
jgi:hypothetical protein